MPLKRRAEKARHHKVSDQARAIWASGRKEMICLYADGSGLICDPELATELGLPQFITMPNMRALADELCKTK
ncbi:hypothetical protein OAN71_00560 [bacterium]|nr:hypothetical protein [bacterium]